MKHTVEFRIVTAYADGGNTCYYQYLVSKKVITNTAKTGWKMRAFRILRPAAAVSIVAAAKTTEVGTCPAASARTMTISALGAWTLGTNETLSFLSIATVLSDVEEGAYETMSCMVPSFDTMLDCIENDTSSDIKDTWVAHPYYADADSIVAVVHLTTTALTNKKLPTSISLVIAETDLVTRDYSGKWLEFGGKGLVTISQVIGKKFEGLLAQIVTYFQTGNSPQALEIPIVIHDMKMGVLV